MLPMAGDDSSGGTGDERAGAELARVLDEAARGLLDRSERESVEHTLGLIVRGAVGTVPHAEQAGISLVERNGGVRSYAPSTETVHELDALQNELGEGPCLDSIWHEQRMLVEDMSRAGDRWPRFAVAAQERGIASLMSFQLFATEGSAGALNLYASRPEVFDESAADTGSLFASQAALVLHGAQRVAGLRTAVTTRDVIGQAKGILMERFGLDAQRAFSMLAETSQTTNMKLVDVARWLTSEAERRAEGESDAS